MLILKCMRCCARALSGTKIESLVDVNFKSNITLCDLHKLEVMYIVIVIDLLNLK